MKRKRNLLLALCALVVLTAGYLILSGVDFSSEEEGETGILLSPLDAEAGYSGLIFSQQSEVISLEKTEDGWAVREQPDFPLSQLAAQHLADRAGTLTASRRLDAVGISWRSTGCRIPRW